MSKTPEELTEDWKAGRLKTNEHYYIELSNGMYFIDFYDKQYEDNIYPSGKGFDHVSKNCVKRVLSSVPDYNDYQQLKESFELAGDYELQEARISELLTKNMELKNKNFLLKKPNGNYPDRISKLKSRIKHLLDLQENRDEEIEILRDLLKECKNIVAHDCWQEAQFPDGQVVQRQDLLTRINIAIGESED